MVELLMRVNQVASKFGPFIQSPDSRVSLIFKERSFRHYQTLGCIDSGERDGRCVIYGQRHFIQALLVRRLLLEKVSAERIAELVRNRSTQELLQGLHSGIQALNPQVMQFSDSGDFELEQTWRRYRIAPGIEVSLCDDLIKCDKASLNQLLGQIRKLASSLHGAQVPV